VHYFTSSVNSIYIQPFRYITITRAVERGIHASKIIRERIDDKSFG